MLLLRMTDGVFETMLWKNGNLPLKKLHFERLESSLQMLEFEKGIDRDKLEAQIQNAVVSHVSIPPKRKNLQTDNKARVRVTVSKSGRELTWQIEAFPYIPLRGELNGMSIDIFPDHFKIIDAFSNLKSTDRIIYQQAGEYAKQKHLDDCLILNERKNICDSGIANIFILKDHVLFTPALSEGCVNGVMRKWLMDYFEGEGPEVKEGIVTIDDVGNADEVFLTNALRGILWVKKFRNVNYGNEFSKNISKHILV